MKINTFATFLSVFLFFTNISLSIAQIDQSDCVSCNGSSASGSYASAIGNGTTASGNHAFAGGYLSIASGSNSFAFGYNSKASQSTTFAIGNAAQATGSGSISIGTYTKATAKNAIAIGSGTASSTPLTNSVANSIALGTNSNKPTLLITKATNNNYTGKVAIGPITSPLAKLHIKSDNSEDSGIFIETSNKLTKKAFIKFFDSNHVLSVDKTGTMSIDAGTGNISLSGEHYSFGNNNEKKIHVYSGESSALYHNAKRTSTSEIRDYDGSSSAIEFSNNGIRFRTAEKQDTRGNEISNWKDMLLLNTDGKIGVGSMTTYLENDGNSLLLHSPYNMNIESGHVTLTGKVGVNTVNQVDDYALAVNGGIISTKVYIKEVNQWPDCVFSDEYEIRSLDALKEYIEEHHHLPGIPSEEEVLKNGYDLHEMQYLMLEKIEEMTRYILILQEEIDELKGKNQTVQFDYDANGNRISRNLLFKKEFHPGQQKSHDISYAYELFPNPTPGQFSLLIKEVFEKKPLHAILMTETGMVLEEHTINSTRTDFDLSKHSNGLYLLEVIGQEGTETWKVIKR